MNVYVRETKQISRSDSQLIYYIRFWSFSFEGGLALQFGASQKVLFKRAEDMLQL